MSYDREYSRIKDINKRLAKDPLHKKVTGVCAGIAKHYNLPRVGVRIAAIVSLIVFPVAAGVAYVVASLLLPNGRSY